MYGTEFMAKSLSFVWCLLGTKPYYQVQLDSHGKILERLSTLIDSNQIKCHLTQRLRLTAEGVRKAHELNEKGSSIGKVGLGVDEAGDGTPFA
jgi:NADPH:quinone reductase-like Zn-dependent oxidoreductase